MGVGSADSRLPKLAESKIRVEAMGVGSADSRLPKLAESKIRVEAKQSFVIMQPFHAENSVNGKDL